MRKYKNPNPDIPGILTYARNNVSVTRISIVFGITPQHVTKILTEHGVTPAVSKHGPKAKKRLEKGVDGQYKEPGDKPPPMKESPSAIAKMTWGSRLTERDGDYFLDNQRIGFTSLMQRTNRRRIDWGMNPVEGDPRWRVE